VLRQAAIDNSRNESRVMLNVLDNVEPRRLPTYCNVHFATLVSCLIFGSFCMQKSAGDKCPRCYFLSEGVALEILESASATF